MCVCDGGKISGVKQKETSRTFFFFFSSRFSVIFSNNLFNFGYFQVIIFRKIKLNESSSINWITVDFKNR
ncbi:Protein CBG25817 [Caenorhabditis briggsae]|uniref:Protein CBG25817 n=1 Tax=Caenorhabditis briggsae TaxID=6238 RepID=B6IEM3_CAEBR|nr:Protein CBG25817 [Caenorhabditis briggsae]CAR98353.1 Protein CBG25817 [Caenorhabditis briggsae]